VERWLPVDRLLANEGDIWHGREICEWVDLAVACCICIRGYRTVMTGVTAARRACARLLIPPVDVTEKERDVSVLRRPEAS
jgi:hypothetical protein